MHPGSHCESPQRLDLEGLCHPRPLDKDGTKREPTEGRTTHSTTTTAGPLVLFEEEQDVVSMWGTTRRDCGWVSRVLGCGYLRNQCSISKRIPVSTNPTDEHFTGQTLVVDLKDKNDGVFDVGVDEQTF